MLFAMSVALAACGSASPAKKAEARLAAVANKVCQLRESPGAPRFPTRDDKLAQALLHEDENLPHVRTLLTDDRAMERTHERLEGHPPHYFQLEEKNFRQQVRVSNDLKALGMSACAGFPQLP